MDKFKIEINETLSKIIEVYAANIEGAMDKVIEMYKNEKIILDYENHINTEFKQL